MMFLKVDKNKRARYGSVYVAVVGKKIIAGRSKGTKMIDIAIELAKDYAKGRSIPSITILQYKKTSDNIALESKLHSLLAVFGNNKDDSYEVTKDELKLVWKDL